MITMDFSAVVAVYNLWRIGNLFMAIFFSLASYVQHNDPDAGIWMLAYGIPAFLCVAQCMKPSISENVVWRYMTVLHLVLCACGEGYILSHSYLSSGAAGKHAQQWFEREEAREFAGLLLVCIWLTLCILQTKTNRMTSPPRLVVWLALLLIITPFILWASINFNKHYDEIQPDHCKGSLKMPSFQM
ncbi:transmembrane protein 220-like [Lytechinus variegatus]|uniref:transmembrane protein 220-like n=1 Tax=Lytechinus variegatus TaxID=7654 RepID=UPI001BB2BA3F|nr:transmembrane protein 220-like [Lytechinus variegatus]